MGSVHSTGSATHVLPEILTFADNGKVLLVHGAENGREFWWPPGAYWLAEKACDLTEEQPDEWIRRVLKAQVNLEPTNVRLRSVEFIDRNHPPVMIYEADTANRQIPSLNYSFDGAKYFAIELLPPNLGRDFRHGEWLKSLLSRDSSKRQ